MKKTVLPLLILCALLCSFFAVTVSADTPQCVISGENVVAAPDSDVTMQVTIANNPGICGAELSVAFPEGVTLVGAESGEAFSALDYQAPSYFRNPSIFMWGAENIGEDDVADGVILTLTFHIDEDVVQTTHCITRGQ